MRAELDSVEAGFNKLPTLTANGNKLVKVNSAGTGLETTSVISDDGTNATVTGDLTIAGGNVGVDADSMHAIPNVAADTLTLNAAAQTLTNKTLFAANNTITTEASGNLSATELNAALAELQSDVDTREKSINAAAAKATPVDADTLGVIDSADTSILKKVTWANVKATLKAYFDTIYISVGNFAASGANSDITSLAGLTTPLSVAQGGTGAGTNAGTAYALKGANSDITSLTAVTNITAAAVTIAADDKVLIQDTSNTDQIKTVTAQAIADLASVPDASETVKGKVELATTAEAVTGTDTARAVTPAGLKAATDALSLSAITLDTAQATKSGTTKDFVIPSGVKLININFDQVSSNANGYVLGIRIGTGGVPATTNYNSTNVLIGSAANTTLSASSTGSASFLAPAMGLGASNLTGTVTLSLIDPSTNTWIASGNLGGNGGTIVITGSRALSGELDIVRIYNSTFDNGKVNVAYIQAVQIRLKIKATERQLN